MRKIFNILFALVLALGLCLVAAVPAVASPGVTTVLVDNLQPSWTAPGGGGVYSVYYGPPDYNPVSPGTTAVYDGREAAPIFAGITIDPSDLIYEDQGLYAFKPNMTIDQLAASSLSWDVEKQYGACPVWMYIELDKGGPNDVMYQFVPTSNPAGWHTVNAAAGLWQKWTDLVSGIPTGPLMTLSQVAGNNTGLAASRCYLTLGMGDSYHDNPNGTVDWVDKVTIGEVTYDFVVPKYWYVATTGSDSNEGTLASPFLTIQHAVSAASAGDTIHVAAGTYPEASQTTIGKNLTIIGADKDTTIIKRNTGFTGNYFFRVDSGEFNLSGVTLDGEGNLYGGVRYAAGTSTGTIDNNIIKNIVSSSYTGFGVVAYGDDVVVSNNIFTNIGRVGVWVGGDNGLVTGNTYTGKGAIDCLDYGIEVGMGGVATITGNTITNCLGVASSDGSTSAAILVTTYYGAGTTATITGNTLTGNTGGIGVGYDEGDTSTVVAHYNNIYGNTDYGIDTTAPVVDALYNWWGDVTGPSHDLNLGGQGDAVSDNVDFSPWLYKTQEQFVSGAPCYAGSVVLDNEATEIDPGSYAGGWNSFSTPITLDGSADTVSELLALTTGSGLFIERAQRFDLASQTWVPVIMGNVVVENYPIKPGEGLFIQVSSGGSIPILVKTTPTSPPMRNLVAGWNLIGMSSLGAETVATALSGVSYSVVLSPKPPNDVAWSVPPAGAGAKELLLGKTYWVAMGGPGILFGFTTTPVADDMTWDLNQ
jgi:Right handed beta helix region